MNIPEGSDKILRVSGARTAVGRRSRGRRESASGALCGRTGGAASGGQDVAPPAAPWAFRRSLKSAVSAAGGFSAETFVP